MKPAGKRKIVDAHVHLYDHRQNRYEFLESEDPMFRALVGDYSSLPRTYTFADLVADAPDIAVEGLVWHEFLSSDPVREILWAQQLAESLPVPVALVGLVDFLAPDLEKTLEVYAGCRNLSAVREHLGWDDGNASRRFAKRSDLLEDSQWLRGLEALRRYRFKCSLEVFAPQLESLLHVVRSYPEIDFSIAVMGWPLATDEAGFVQWRRSLRALSACANTVLVISAIECVFGMNWSLTQVQPWIDSAFALFGPGRIMFGSHRPICMLSPAFPDPYKAHEALTAGRTEAERDAVFRTNAFDWFFAGLRQA